jgi:EmrB/QacA subfamily drug resistance transporter
MESKDLSRRRIWSILGGVMSSLLLASLDNTIVGTAMPKIIHDLKGMEHYSWPFTAYMLFSTTIIPIAGKLSDIYGRKLIVLIGLTIFITASALCGLSSDMMQLIIFRGLQGLGGGVLVSSSFIIVGQIFTPRERGKYMGLLVSMFGVASVLGPTVGGFITDTLSWRWVFYVNLPLGLLTFFTLSVALPSLKDSQEKRQIDLMGLISFLMGVFPLLLGFSEAGKEYAWSSPQIMGLFAFSIVMLGLFIFLEHRSKEPLLSLGLFKNGVFTVCVVASFLGSAGMFGAVIFIPLFAQGVMGVSAMNSGFITTPMMVAMVVGSNISGRLSVRLDKYRSIGVAGFIFSLAGTIMLSSMGADVSRASLIFNVALLGTGMGVVIPIFTIAAQNAFPLARLGTVSSVLQFFRNMGGTVSSAIMGSVMLSSFSAKTAALQSASVPQEIQVLLKDTRVLSDPAAIARVRSHVPESFVEQFNTIVLQAKTGLANSIINVFLLCTFILLVGMIVAFFLDERAVQKGVKEHHSRAS